jgi:predicted metal-dependent hydrolase
MSDFSTIRANIQIKPSTRARRLRLTVESDGSVILTKPASMSDQKALTFAETKQSWIVAAVTRQIKADILPIPKPSKTHFEKYKREARLLVVEKLKRFNSFYNFSYNNVTIKNQTTRWGSCSKTRNLNFSYRIIFLPEHLQDYLIVHELCHLKEFDHGRAFWSLVKEQVPVAHIREFKKRVR